MARFTKGRVPWNKGLVGLATGFQKGNQLGVGKKYMLGRKHKPETIEKIRQGNLGKNVTPESRNKISMSKRGRRSHFWRGGVSSLNEKERRSAGYKLWRKTVFERDEYTCQFCKVRGGTLNADHILPLAYYPELRFDLENGRTLCASCHKLTETYGAHQEAIR